MPTDSSTHRELHLPNMTDASAIKQNANGIWMLEGEQLWDLDLLPVCLEHIREGDTVIDAGAWIGGHTMAYAKKVGMSGSVHSFEPNPFAFECLKRNTNRLPNVQRIDQSLGDIVDIVPFSTKKGWLDSGSVGWGGPEETTVVMSLLDEFQLAPNFIKIDVEGCELKVLKGAEKTIEKHRPIMVIEVNRTALERQGHSYKDIWKWLNDHRYDYISIEEYTGQDVYNLRCMPK